MKRIVALDPGGTTGWAMWQEEAFSSQIAPPWDHFTCGQLENQEHHEDLYAFLELQQTSDFTIVCESFEFRQRTEDASRHNIVLVSREYIGVAKLFAAQRMLGQQNQTVVLQTAGLAKGFIPDKAKDGLEANAKLKVMGLYVPGKPHANDAMRHLIYYMVNRLGHRHLIKSWRNLV